MTQQVHRLPHQHHAGDGEEHDRVVLAGRQAVAIDRLRREHDGQDADHHQHQVDEQAEVVRGDHAEAFGAAIPQQHRRDACTDQPDDRQAAERHALPAAAERLREQHDEARQRHAEDRDDGVELTADHHRTTSATTTSGPEVLRSCGLDGSGFGLRRNRQSAGSPASIDRGNTASA